MSMPVTRATLEYLDAASASCLATRQAHQLMDQMLAVIEAGLAEIEQLQERANGSGDDTGDSGHD